MENIFSNKSKSEQQRQRWRINAANRRCGMTSQQKLIEQSKTRKNNPENTTNIVQIKIIKIIINKSHNNRMQYLCCRSVTNACRDVKKIRTCGYLRIKPATGRKWILKLDTRYPRVRVFLIPAC